MTTLITGANRGIGAALLSIYRSEGQTVIGTRRSDAADGWLKLDVTDPASQKAMGDRLKGQPINLLVCNAGVYFDKGEDLQSGYPADMWADTFAANVTGVFLTVQTLLPNLRLANNARIAIISSQMASHERAPGGSYIYRASKAAALNLGRNLATDLRSDGISVGIYHPGWARSDMGGDHAEISVEEAANGLHARFEALNLQNTGCFETWDGRPHPY